MTFGDCVVEAAGNAEFVSNWMRLRGISLATSPIDMMIDDATGRNAETAKLFLADVHDLIWSRLPPPPMQGDA